MRLERARPSNEIKVWPQCRRILAPQTAITPGGRVLLGGPKRCSGCVAALLAAAILSPAEADEPMYLGARASVGSDFQLAAGDRVFFSESSAVLGARARAALAAQAAWLMAHSTLSVTVEGHADD